MSIQSSNQPGISPGATGSQQKITAIAFHKNIKNDFLNQFEESFLFCLLNKLTMSNQFTVKDYATGLDKIQLPDGVKSVETYQELHRIARKSQAGFVLYGNIKAPIPISSDTIPINALDITLRLFDHHQNEISLEKTVAFQHFLPANPKNPFDIELASFEQLLETMTLAVLQSIFPKLPAKLAEQYARIPISQSYQAIYALAQSNRMLKQIDRLRQLEMAIEADAQCELAYVLLAKYYRLGRHYEKSVLHYRRALEVCQGTNRTRAIYATDAGIACALLVRDDVTNNLPLQWWQRAIQLDPNYINPYFNIANVFEDQQKYEEAALYFQKAQALAPKDGRTMANLARIYSKLNQWEGALKQYLQQLLTEDGNDPWCHSDIAMCYLNLGNTEEASKHFNKAIDIDPQGEAGDYAKLILGNLG